MTCLAIALQPAQLLEAWRQDTGRLVLPGVLAARPQQKTAVRIRIEGRLIEATIFGTVVSSNGSGARQATELAPDGEGLRALRLLAAAARGEPIRFLQRAPRYSARLPVFVDFPGSRVYMATFSVSESGCGLVWSGSMPSMGQSLRLRFGAGMRSAELRGVVCWTRDTRPGAAVGVRLVHGRASSVAWEGLLVEARKSGAPT